MYQYTGVNTSYALHSVNVGTLQDWTHMVRLRTTSAVVGAVVIGALRSNDQVFMDLNTGAAGRVGYQAQNAGRIKYVYFTAPTLFNGFTHTVIWTRTGTTIRAWLDGVEQALTVVTNTLLAGDKPNVTVPFAVAGKNNNGAIQNSCACSVGEYALWNSVLSDNLIVWLGGGLAPDAISPAPAHYWRGLNSNAESIGGATWALNNATAAAHPFAFTLPLSADFGDPAGPRYELYLADGAPPDPTRADVNRLVIPRSVTTPAIYGGTYPAGRMLYASVYARNATGRSTLATTFMVPADGGGTPVLLPTPVTNVRARPLALWESPDGAGGYVEVAWSYRELSPEPGAIAAQFRIQPSWAEVLGPGEAPTIYPAVVVPHSQPREEYRQVMGPFSDALYAFTVAAETAGGLSYPGLTAAYARADSTAPTTPALSLSLV